MTLNESPRWRAQANIAAFESFVRERDDLDDWAEWANVAQTQLRRLDIAVRCGFGRGVLRQNPAIRERLCEVEDDLRRKGILSPLVIDQAIIVARNEAIRHRDDEIALLALRFTKILTDITNARGLIEEKARDYTMRLERIRTPEGLPDILSVLTRLEEGDKC